MSKKKKSNRRKLSSVGTGVALGLTFVAMTGTAHADSPEVLAETTKVSTVADTETAGKETKEPTAKEEVTAPEVTTKVEEAPKPAEKPKTEEETPKTTEKPKTAEETKTTESPKTTKEETTTTSQTTEGDKKADNSKKSDSTKPSEEATTSSEETPKPESPKTTEDKEEPTKPVEDSNVVPPVKKDDKDQDGKVSTKPSEENPPKEEKPKEEERPKEEKPGVEDKPNEDDKPNEEKPKDEDKKPSVDVSVGDNKFSVSEGDKPKEIEVNEENTFEGKLKNISGTVTYSQVLQNGIRLPLDGNILPTNSQLVASYIGVDGEEHNIVVANITTNKTYSLNVKKSDGSILDITPNKDQYLKGDSPSNYYSIKEGDLVVGYAEIEGSETTANFNLDGKLSEGEHTLTIESRSRYGVSTVGTVTVNVPKKEVPKPQLEPEVPTPQPEPEKPVIPVPTPQPEPEKPSPQPVPDRPVIPVPEVPSTPTEPSTPSVPTTPVVPTEEPSVNPGNANIINPEAPVTPQPPKEEPKVEAPIVKEAPKGISDITIGGNSLYGDQSNKDSSVASNGDTTTFTRADSLDLKVSVDTKVVDTSRTEIKLIGRAQGELNSSEFVEYKDGHYSIKGIAEDDYYTLVVKTYDSNGKLVSDTTENFSINKKGSSYSIVNYGLEGHSFKAITSNIQLLESNVDKINADKTTIKVFKDGKEISIPKDAIKVSRSGGVNGNWQYTYTIDKSFFEKEGVYTIEVFSQTETGVKYSSSNRTMQFIVDNTAPQISITGIRDGGRYKSNEKRITIDVRDISKLKSVKAYLNGKEVKLQYDEKTGLYYYDMKSTGQDRNEFVVEAEDEAGNLSTVSVKNFLLSPNLAFSIFNDDNLLYLLAGVGTSVAGFLAYLGFRRKRKLDEEDRLALEQAELLAASHSSNGSNKNTTTGFVEESTTDRVKVEDIISVSTQDLVEVEEFENIATNTEGTAEYEVAFEEVEEDISELEDHQENFIEVNQNPVPLAELFTASIATADLDKTEVLPEEDLAKTDVLSEEEELAKTDILPEDGEIAKTDVLPEEDA